MKNSGYSLKPFGLLDYEVKTLTRIIEAGATIDAEEESSIHNSRKFAHALVAIESSSQVNFDLLLQSNRPTAVRARAAAKLSDDNRLQELLKDKESTVRTEAAKRLLKNNPEDINILLSLLEHPKLEAAFAALESIIQTKEGAIEDTLWTQQLNSPNSLLVRRTLEALSVLELIKAPEEAEALLRPIFKDTSLSILLPLNRIVRSLGLNTEEISWPEDLKQKRQIAGQYPTRCAAI